MYNKRGIDVSISLIKTYYFTRIIDIAVSRDLGEYSDVGMLDLGQRSGQSVPREVMPL